MTYVFSEGLDRYLAERLKSIFPEEYELSTFQPYGKIDMFASLGADDMWLDLNAPREPAKNSCRRVLISLNSYTNPG